MTDFSTLITPHPLGSGRFAIDIPDGWQQGRGAYGGIAVALLARAIEAEGAESEPRPLRSLTAELCAPLLVGPASLRVEVLRRGSGMSTLAARIEQDGAVVAHGVGILARTREDVAYVEMVPPRMIPWRECAPLPEEVGAPFGRFFEFRPTGPAPFSGGTEGRAEGWVRLREPGPTRDAAFLGAMADAFWPGVFSRLEGLRPVATVSFTLQIVGSTEGLDPTAPLYHRGRVQASREGYVAELRELWGEDGRLLALNPQTVALIR